MLQNGMGPNSQRAWLGINAVERQGRIQIVRVTPESPAQLAGVVPGLWLLGLNGKPVESLSAFYKQLWAIPINSESAQLTIFDGRTIYQIPVPIVDRSTNIKNRQVFSVSDEYNLPQFNHRLHLFANGIFFVRIASFCF